MAESNYRVIIFYIMIIIILITIFLKDLIANFKDFKNNFEYYIGLITAVFLITVLLSALSFIVIDSITGDISSNHANNLDADIIEMILILVMYAPIAEELLFRGCLRKLIKNNLSFILISSISFGLFHVVEYVYVEQDLAQSLYAIPYGIMGVGFAYIYVKTNNIYTNITAHFIMNTLATFSAIFDKPV